MVTNKVGRMRDYINDGGCCSNECGAEYDAEERHYVLQKCELMARTGKTRESDYLFLCEIYRGIQRDGGSTVSFEVLGKRCCKKFFLAAHAASAGYYRQALRYVKEVGLFPRIHGNTGKRNRALNEVDIRRVEVFLNKYGQEYGLPDPGRIRSSSEKIVFLLPARMTKISVYLAYCESLMNYDSSLTLVSKSSFMKIWKEVCSHVYICSPATDLCTLCVHYNQQIYKAATRQRRLFLTNKWQDHLQLVDRRRLQYRLTLEICRSNMKEMGLRKEDIFTVSKTPCSLKTRLHYDFDFAANFAIPHHVRQEGKLYYESEVKVNCFGVSAAFTWKQVFFIYNEAEHGGKGASAVISLLDAFFEKYGCGEESVSLTMDNCGGQNKNNSVLLHYPFWRVFTGRHNEVSIELLEPNHAKMSCDQHFALARRRYLHSDVESMEDISTVIRNSSVDQSHIPVRVTNEKREQQIFFREWRYALFQYLKKYSGDGGIAAIRYVFVNRDLASRGLIRIGRDGPQGITIDYPLLKAGLTPLTLPQIPLFKPCNVNDLTLHLPPVEALPGYTPARQWYLYDKLRKLFRTEAGKEQMCPLPTCQRPASSESQSFRAQTFKKKLQRLSKLELQQLCKEKAIHLGRLATKGDMIVELLESRDSVMPATQSQDDPDVFKNRSVVEEILHHQVEDGIMYFLIKWRDYDILSWEPEENLFCPELLLRYKTLALKDIVVGTRADWMDGCETPEITVANEDNTTPPLRSLSLPSSEKIRESSSTTIVEERITKRGRQYLVSRDGLGRDLWVAEERVQDSDIQMYKKLRK